MLLSNDSSKVRVAGDPSEFEPLERLLLSVQEIAGYKYKSLPMYIAGEEALGNLRQGGELTPDVQETFLDIVSYLEKKLGTRMTNDIPFVADARRMLGAPYQAKQYDYAKIRAEEVERGLRQKKRRDDMRDAQLKGDYVTYERLRKEQAKDRTLY